MITREILSAFFDELEKLALPNPAGMIAPALLERGARTQLAKGVLPNAASLAKGNVVRVPWDQSETNKWVSRLRKQKITVPTAQVPQQMNLSQVAA